MCQRVMAIRADRVQVRDPAMVLVPNLRVVPGLPGKEILVVQRLVMDKVEPAVAVAERVAQVPMHRQTLVAMVALDCNLVLLGRQLFMPQGVLVEAAMVQQEGLVAPVVAALVVQGVPEQQEVLAQPLGQQVVVAVMAVMVAQGWGALSLFAISQQPKWRPVELLLLMWITVQLFGYILLMRMVILMSLRLLMRARAELAVPE